MNKIEFLGLSSSSLYNFHFYFGDTKSGILLEREDKYYLIESSKIKLFNENPSNIDNLIAAKVIVQVNIETITKWEQIK